MCALPISLEFLCSYSEMETTAFMLLQEHHDAAQGCDPLQFNKKLPNNIFPIKNWQQYQARSYVLLTHYTKFNSGVSSDGVKKN